METTKVSIGGLTDIEYVIYTWLKYYLTMKKKKVLLLATTFMDPWALR